MNGIFLVKNMGIKEEYISCLKPAGEIVNTVIFRPIAFPIVMFGKKMKITPNAITMVSGIFQFISAYLFLIQNDPITLVLAGLFLFIKQIGDCVDGSLARNNDQSSEKGALLDLSIDTLGMFLMTLAIAINQFNRDGDPIVYLYFILFFISFAVQCHIHADVRTRYTKQLNEDFEESYFINIGNSDESNGDNNFLNKIITETIKAETRLFLQLSPGIDLSKYQNTQQYEEIRLLYRKRFKNSAILWSVIGGSATILEIVIFAWIGEIGYIWFMSIIFNNFLIILLSYMQNNYTPRFEEKINEINGNKN